MDQELRGRPEEIPPPPGICRDRRAGYTGRMPDLLAPRSRVVTKRLPCILAAAGALALLAAAPADQTDAPAAPPEMKGQPMAFIGVGVTTSCTGFLRAAATERDQRPPGAADPNQVRTALYGALMAWTDGYLTAKNEDELLHRVAGNTTTLTPSAAAGWSCCSASQHRRDVLRRRVQAAGAFGGGGAVAAGEDQVTGAFDQIAEPLPGLAGPAHELELADRR